MKHFKIFSQLFYGNEVNLNKPLKKKERNLESRDQFYLFLILKNTFVYFYFISIKASIRNAKYCYSPIAFFRVVLVSGYMVEVGIQ